MSELLLHLVDKRADRVQRQCSLRGGNLRAIGREPGRRAGTKCVFVCAVPLEKRQPAPCSNRAVAIRAPAARGCCNEALDSVEESRRMLEQVVIAQPGSTEYQGDLA